MEADWRNGTGHFQAVVLFSWKRLLPEYYRLVNISRRGLGGIVIYSRKEGLTK